MTYATSSNTLPFDGFKCAIVELYKNPAGGMPTLNKRIQRQRERLKSRINLNNKNLSTIEAIRSKSTMRRPSVEIGLESDQDKRTDITSRVPLKLNARLHDSTSAYSKYTRDLNMSTIEPNMR